MIVHVHVWMRTEKAISLLCFHTYLITELLLIPHLVLYKLLLQIVLLLLEVEPATAQPASDAFELIVIQVSLNEVTVCFERFLFYLG